MLAASCRHLCGKASGCRAAPLDRLGRTCTWYKLVGSKHVVRSALCRRAVTHSWRHNAVSQAHDIAADAPKQPPRFYAQPGQLPTTIGSTVELEAEEARHAVRVLRLKPGDAVELCDGRGRMVAAEIVRADKGSAMVAATAMPQLQQWQGPQWVVAVGCLTLKGGRTDWLVEKCTELGAHAVLPLITERSQAAGKNKFRTSESAAKQPKGGTSSSDGGASDGYQPGRLERLAIAATKQSLRVHALEMQAPLALDQLLPLVESAPLSLVATAGAPPLRQVLANADAAGATAHMQQQACYLIIGPEGDFTPEELQALQSAGAQAVGLGANRLRTETAAIALLSATMLWADSRT